MRTLLIACLTATLAVLVACATPPRESRFPVGTPRQCVFIEVDNQNFNRIKIYLTNLNVKVGEVEGVSKGVLRYCPTGPTPEDFTIEGWASSFHLRLSNGSSLDPSHLSVLTIGADPQVSFLGGA